MKFKNVEGYRVRIDGEVTRPRDDLEWMVGAGVSPLLAVGTALEGIGAPLIGYTYQECPTGVDPDVWKRIQAAWPIV